MVKQVLYPYTKNNRNMKRIILFGIVILCCACSCFGQTKSRRLVEFELGLGVMQSFNNLIFEQSMPGACPYAEAKYVFKKVPVDLGVNLSGQIFSRVGENEKLDFMSCNVMAVSDYSFYQTSKMRLFAGLGVGLSFFDWDHHIKRVGPTTYASGAGDYSMLCAMPRIGINFYNHLNMSLGYLFEDTAHSNLNLRVAYMF